VSATVTCGPCQHPESTDLASITTDS